MSKIESKELLDYYNGLLKIKRPEVQIKALEGAIDEVNKLSTLDGTLELDNLLKIYKDYKASLIGYENRLFIGKDFKVAASFLQTIIEDIQERMEKDKNKLQEKIYNILSEEFNSATIGEIIRAKDRIILALDD